MWTAKASADDHMFMKIVLANNESFLFLACREAVVDLDEEEKENFTFQKFSETSQQLAAHKSCLEVSKTCVGGRFRTIRTQLLVWVSLRQSLIQLAHADRPQATGLKLPDAGVLLIQLAQDCLSQSMS